MDLDGFPRASSGEGGVAERSGEYEHLEPLLVEFAALPVEDDRRRRLHGEIVSGFLPVAVNIARRYCGRGEALDDLEQAASIGLLHAVHRYDPARGRNFLSYAIPTIIGEVRRHFRDSAWSVNTRRTVKERFLAVNAATATMAQDLGRAPTTSELASYLGLSHEQVLEAVAARNSYRSGSLDEALGGDDTSLVDILRVIDADLEQVEVRDLVRQLVLRLPEWERTMIVLRYVHEKTQAEIATELGVSQMHVSRLLTRSLRTLRAISDAGGATWPATGDKGLCGRTHPGA